MAKPNENDRKKIKVIGREFSWEDTQIASDLVGMNLISEFVKHLPNAPGVYRMFNADQMCFMLAKPSR